MNANERRWLNFDLFDFSLSALISVNQRFQIFCLS